MKLAFYQARGTWVDRVIRWRTNGPYSHVELVFSDGVSFSAKPREGVRFTSLIQWIAGDWFFVEIPAAYNEPLVRRWAERQLGKRYGYWELARFLFPFLPVLAGEKFCSQVCLNALKQTVREWGAIDPADVGPSKLALLALELR